MCEISDIAEFFICLSLPETEDGMTNLRLNKLMYFSQGWHLKKYGKPLFTDAIKAWKLGPVIPSIYNKYKGFGKCILNPDIDNISSITLTESESDLLLDVYCKYRSISTAGLVDLTHQPNSPWENAFSRGNNTTISTSEIKKYFDNLPPLESYPNILNIEKVGYLDKKTGLTVLPKEFDDGEDYSYLDT